MAEIVASLRTEEAKYRDVEYALKITSPRGTRRHPRQRARSRPRRRGGSYSRAIGSGSRIVDRAGLRVESPTR